MFSCVSLNIQLCVLKPLLRYHLKGLHAASCTDRNLPAHKGQTPGVFLSRLPILTQCLSCSHLAQQHTSSWLRMKCWTPMNCIYTCSAPFSRMKNWSKERSLSIPCLMPWHAAELLLGTTQARVICCRTGIQSSQQVNVHCSSPAVLWRHCAVSWLSNADLNLIQGETLIPGFFSQQ